MCAKGLPNRPNFISRDAKSIATKPNRQTRHAKLISKHANEFSIGLNIKAKGGNKMAEVAK
jgi:hypothetical protein